uniref:Uncharacterized protein n=1 Tax=Candidatus Kentrum sp. FM TaxID=2126340 RepID=A0A450T7U2_9GAMM|nr:MAG: protein of unknown function (DUF4407) [Candidatus Kentron sp. FM]VFJ62581.1 MAG: protein of unknown function (DUF4407) [Candidatus Kentron sp. FM]VFK15366.1 MAG: protein of unknown function (DUF4407) [Candidatus Kentron sp. FM]
MNNGTERTQSWPNSVTGLESNLKRFVSLHQYGESMMTPAVRGWLRSAWVIIFLMALVEAVVWFFVSQYFVAESERWVTVYLAPVFFVGIFVLIWVIDVSFITYERLLGIEDTDPNPSNESTDNTGAESGEFRLSSYFHRGKQVRWWFGVAIRLAIVFISIVITAPFLAQTIRSDEIADKYQAMLDKARKAKEAELVVLLDAEILRLQKQREDLSKKLARLDAERDLVIRDSAAPIEAAWKQIEDNHKEYLAEVAGEGSRKPGQGPKAKAAMKARDDARSHWKELVQRKNEKLTRIEQRSSEPSAKLDRIDREKLEKEDQRAKAQAVFKPMDFTTFAEEYDLEVPADTIGTRVRLLAELRAEDLAAFDPKNEYEKWVFHFSSVEGLSQALLGILFLAMLALKLFEPKAVKLYFNDEIQHQWRRYLDGGFDQEPDFVPSTDSHPYNPFGFTHVYLYFRTSQREKEKALIAKIRLEKMEQERHLQEEISLKTEFERKQTYAKKELSIKSEKLDHELKQEKRDIDNKYRELEKQYRAETAAVREEFKRKHQEEKDRSKMEREKERIEVGKLKEETEDLKRNRELREKSRAKFLEILEERKKMTEERTKGVRARNERKELEAKLRYGKEDLERLRAILKARKSEIEKEKERMADVDATLDEIRRKLEGSRDINEIQEEIKEQEKRRDDFAEARKNKSGQSRRIETIAKLKDEHKRLSKLIQKKEKLTQERKDISEKLEKYKAGIEQVEEDIKWFFS